MNKQELARAALEIKKICSDNKKCPGCPFLLSSGGYDECIFEFNGNIEIPENWLVSQEDIERLERENNDA